MSRYRSQSAQDDPAQPDGDAGFTGMDTSLAPDYLGRSVLARVENGRIDTGAVGPRYGIQPLRVSWTAGALPWTCAAFISLPDRPAYLCAGHDAALQLVNLTAGHSIVIPRPASETEDLAAVDYRGGSIMQAFGQVLLWRGPDRKPLLWSGDEAATALTYVTETVGDGWMPMPWSDHALYHADRLWIPQYGYRVVWSDIGEIGQYAFTSFVDVNDGDGSPIVRLWAARNNVILIFKERSIWSLRDAVGDLSVMSLELVSDQVGLVARECIFEAEGDTYFLSAHGLVSLRQVLDSREQIAARPWSDPVRADVANLLVQARLLTQGRRHNLLRTLVYAGRLYFFYPAATGATGGRCLTYNFTLPEGGAWESFDRYSQPAAPFAQLALEYSGRPFLAVIDQASGVHLYDYDFDPEDRTHDGTAAPVLWRYLTRGYNSGNRQRKRFRLVQLDLDTWAADYRVRALTDGAAETETVLDRHQPSRTRFTTFATADFDPSNDDNRADLPDREDYSVRLPDAASGFAMTGTEGDGYDVERVQSWQQRLRLRLRGQYLQVELTPSAAVGAAGTTGGRVTLRGVMIEALETDRAYSLRT